MSADVINIQDHQAEAVVWRCLCGTISFMVLPEGTLECCGCRKVQLSSTGAWVIPDTSKTDNVVEFPSVKRAD